MNSTDFVQRVFGEYYKHFSLAETLKEIERREFGFISFEGRMLRHKSFKNEKDLQNFLREFVPRDAYISSAYYEEPEAEMEKKVWLGADLIFDIDADHIPTPCDKIHDEWICGKCGFAGKGIVPEKCPICGGEKFDDRTWPCEVCLNSAKDETIRILDILKDDFGFSEKEAHVFFSGHRGYHIHVENDAVKTLDAFARKEIVDYALGLGFEIFPSKTRKKDRATRVLKGLKLKDPGWRGRVARSMHKFVATAKKEDYEKLGLKKGIIEKLIEGKNSILKLWENDVPWNAVKGVGFETWKKIAEFCAKSEAVNIDTVVTTDVHRLIRLSETLHGKTGLKKVEFPMSKIVEFDPLKDAVALKGGTTTVLVSDAPKFRLGEETFGPYKNQKVELPVSAAILLICKGRAEVAE
ncbi:MAG: DNA primase small subunit PriS [Candidatus Bathyarchaeia archaeon]